MKYQCLIAFVKEHRHWTVREDMYSKHNRKKQGPGGHCSCSYMDNGYITSMLKTSNLDNSLKPALQ